MWRAPSERQTGRVGIGRIPDGQTFLCYVQYYCFIQPPPQHTHTHSKHQNQRTSSVKIGQRSRSSAKRSDARHPPTLNSSSFLRRLFDSFSSSPPSLGYPPRNPHSQRAARHEMKASKSRRVLGGARCLAAAFAAEPPLMKDQSVMHAVSTGVGWGWGGDQNLPL